MKCAMCQQPARSSGLCWRHYQSERTAKIKAGTWTPMVTRPRKVRDCWCGEVGHALDQCLLHYQQSLRAKRKRNTTVISRAEVWPDKGGAAVPESVLPAWIDGVIRLRADNERMRAEVELLRAMVESMGVAL